jgi:hypothetical protein
LNIICRVIHLAYLLFREMISVNKIQHIHQEDKAVERELLAITNALNDIIEKLGSPSSSIPSDTAKQSVQVVNVGNNLYSLAVQSKDGQVSSIPGLFQKTIPSKGTSGKVLTSHADGSLDFETPTGSGDGVSLGETETTAYRGDRGKTGYDHSQIAHAPSGAEANVNADWDSTSGDSEILNKPTIPSGILTIPYYLTSGTEDAIPCSAFELNFYLTNGTQHNIALV